MAFTNRYSELLRRIPWILVAVTGILTVGCTTPAQLQGAHYVHLLYQHPAGKHYADSPLTILFIEGDGIPWTNHGTQPSKDPTPFHALAYNLYKSTPYRAWYLTRPCYNHVRDSHCNNLVWTFARYSDLVVSSMTSAIKKTLASQPGRQLVLVGYSGGGTLAALIAPRIPQVVGVISVAGNLDTDAWTTLHGYEPLSASLNPAHTSGISVPFIALVGDRDRNVPFASIAGFLNSHPHVVVEHFANYNHVCCWEKHWPATLNQALARLNINLR